MRGDKLVLALTLLGTVAIATASVPQKAHSLSQKFPLSLSGTVGIVTAFMVCGIAHVQSV
jgi:hypothetical protein